MIFNIAAGGFSSTIKVTTAAGATVTCELSPYSFSATADVYGVVTFTALKTGTWTVTASKSGITASGTASVTGTGQEYNVSLPLRKWLFKEGEGAKVTLTTVGSRTEVTSASIRLWDASSNTTRVYTASNIDMTPYSKMVLTYSDGSESTACKIKVQRYSNSTVIKTYDKSSSKTTVSTGVASASYTDKLELALTSSPTASHYIYNWYLEV